MMAQHCLNRYKIMLPNDSLYSKFLSGVKTSILYQKLYPVYNADRS